MSASLVGSEMCIRDSNERFTHTEHTASSSQLAPSVSCTEPLTSLPAAVSYTHLTLPTICSV
eukprot:5672607-Alexandrium_andersonii.AAC.1